MNYWDDVGFAYQQPPGLINAPIRRDTRRKQLEEEQARRTYQGLLERDLIGIQQFSPFFGLNSRDPDAIPVAPMDVVPAGAIGKGMLAIGALGGLIKKGAPFTRVKSGASKGQYVGAPRGLDTPQKFGALLRDYEQLVDLGKEGRYFYEDTSNYFLRATGGDVPEATKLAKTMAVNSQGAALDQNFGWGIKGHYQGSVGDPINTGRFPGEQGKAISKIYAGGDPNLGPKREPYAQNLQAAWNPNLHENPVNDIWQGRAFGYTGLKIGII